MAKFLDEIDLFFLLPLLCCYCSLVSFVGLFCFLFCFIFFYVFLFSIGIFPFLPTCGVSLWFSRFCDSGTSNWIEKHVYGKSEFVPRDHVFPLLVLNCFLFPQKIVSFTLFSSTRIVFIKNKLEKHKRVKTKETMFPRFGDVMTSLSRNGNKCEFKRS